MTTTDKANKLLLIITKPEVRKFVEAQKIKEIETVESFYKKKISKHKKIITPKKRKIINTIKN